MNSLLHWLTAPEWSQVVKTLLHSLWQGALVAAALALIMRRLANPYARYRCSLVALTAIPVAGIITWAILNAINHQPTTAPLPIATEAAPTPDLVSLNQNPATKLIVFASRAPAPPQSGWTAWLALAWLVGAIAMLGRAGVKVTGAERLRRACQPLDHPQIAQLFTEARRAVGLARKIHVAVTDKLTSPAVVGVLVPTLILPLSLVTTLTPEQIRFILLHELAHIRRGDYFANLFQLFTEALLFFNPAVWWISHQVRREREACCDALAIELSGAPADYARTLVHVAESVLCPTPASATSFGGDREPSSLADRVQRLLVPGYRPSLRLTWRAMIGAFVLGATLLVLSAEGTRVAVAQIAKSNGEAKQSTAPSQSKETLPFENMTELSNQFTNEFKLGEQTASGDFGSRFPVKRIVFESPELERVKRSLNDLRFKFVGCSNKPLGELFRELSEQSETLNKDGVGLMFSVIPIRLRTISATIDPPLTNASLSEILAAIQGAPQLRLNGVNTNGLVTLQTITSLVAQKDPKRENELEAGKRQPHEGDTRSIETNSPPIEISGSSELSRVEYDIATGKTVITNGGVVRFKDTVVRADTIQLDRQNGQLTASGNVRIETPSGVTDSATTVMNIYSNAPLSAVPGKLIYTSEKRRAIMNKLTQIQLERVSFDAMPLSSVVHTLVEEAKRRDPEGRGVNIIVNPNVTSSEPGPAFDIGDIRITVTPPLTKVRLADALDAIVKGSSRPLHLAIEEYAVVISLKGNEVTPLFLREYKVKPAFFDQLRKKGYSIEVVASTNHSANSESICRFFTNSGIDLLPTEGKSVFCNHNLGVLLVRATMDELDRVEQLLVELNKPYPQINIKTRFVEVSRSELEAFVPDLIATMKPADGQNWAGILTEPQMNQVLQRIQTNQNLSVLSEGEVTTASGRQAQFQVVEAKTIVTDINPKALTPPGITSTNKDGSGESLLITTNLWLGPVIDIFPAITPDGYSVALTVIPRVTEFFGYEGPTNTVVVYENGKKGTTIIPQPRFRTQQMTNNAVVRDGMTLVLGALPVERTTLFKDKIPFLGDLPWLGRLFRSESAHVRTNILLVFVTPTIVDPAAQRIHVSASTNSPAR